MQPDKDWVVGVAMGVERTNIDNFFNPAGAGEQDTTGITLAPYIGGLLTDWLSVDATVNRLRRYVYLKSQLLFLHASHFN